MAEIDVAGAQSLHRAFALLRIVAANNPSGLRLIDVVQISGLNRSTAHRMLQALDREGLVMHDVLSEKYYLGPEAFILGVAAEDRFGIRSAGAASLSMLARQSKDSALLMVRRGAEAVCVGREEGSFPIRTHMAHPGHRTPLGVGGASLAILAALPDSEVDWILAHNAKEIEGYPNYSTAAIRSFVRETRETGFAVNPGRVVSESWAVAVAVIKPDGACDSALSLAGVGSRIEPRILELAELLTAEAQRLSDRTYRPALVAA